MDHYIGKKYKLKSSENFEEYLKFIDIGLISRKTATAVSPIAHLVKNDDGSYTFMMSTTFRTVSFSFKPGEEFEEERADGVKVKSKIEFAGDSMVQTQTEANGRVSTHVRQFNDTTLLVTSTVDGWPGKCVRTYELLK
ncbi:hypothetical protein O0L34_g14233 [Tuta absoluta]|nr:hypothetical protein O0L34_g14233 [Tuta absoluta]